MVKRNQSRLANPSNLGLPFNPEEKAAYLKNPLGYMEKTYIKDGLTMEEIGFNLGISRQRVQQICKSLGIGGSSQKEVGPRFGGRPEKALGLVSQGLNPREAAKKVGLLNSGIQYFLARYFPDEPKLVRSECEQNAAHLIKRYSVDGVGSSTIARELNKSPQTVLKWLRDLGINRGLPPSKTSFITKEWLVESYLNQGRTRESLAEELNISIGRVNQLLVKFGLSGKKKKSLEKVLLQVNTEWLIESYKTKTQKELADELGIHLSSLRKLLIQRKVIKPPKKGQSWNQPR